MPRETIARILDIEEQAAQVTADAQGQADQIVVEAKQSVEALRQRVLQQAQERADRIIAEGEEKATEERDALLSAAKADVADMEALAGGHFEQAVQFVLAQVVESAQT